MCPCKECSGLYWGGEGVLAWMEGVGREEEGEIGERESWGRVEEGQRIWGSGWGVGEDKEVRGGRKG